MVEMCLFYMLDIYCDIMELTVYLFSRIVSKYDIHIEYTGDESGNILIPSRHYQYYYYIFRVVMFSNILFQLRDFHSLRCVIHLA